MENKLALNIRSCAAKAGRRFLALFLTCAMIFSLSACGGQKTTGETERIKPVTAEREPEPQARGYMSGILWEQPFKVALAFTKVSD